MASVSTRDPRSFTISDLLFKFNLRIGGEALSALEARDDVWRSENDALRAECLIRDADMRELLSRSRWLEEELSKEMFMRQTMVEGIAKFEDKESWLLEKIRRLEDGVCKAERAERVKREEVGAVLEEKALLEANLEELLRRLAEVESEKDRTANEKRRSEEEKKVRILGLSRRIEDLEREMRDMEKQMAMEAEKGRTKKMTLEAEKRRTEKEKKKVSELIMRIEVLEREKGEMEAEVCKLKMEKSREMEKVLKEKMGLEDEKRRLEEETEKISELVQRVGVLEREKGDIEAECCKIKREKSTEFEMDLETQKRRMEEEFNKKISELVQRSVIVERENKAMEAEVSNAKRERNRGIRRILSVKMALEAEKRRVEEEKEKISDLVQRIRVLEREKDEMEAEVFKAKKDKKNEAQWMLSVKTALVDRMRRMEEANKKIVELDQGIGALQRAKEVMEAKVLKVNREKSEEIDRINEKIAVEAEKRSMEEEDKKKVSELVQRIEVLEREKGKMEVEVSRANGEKNEAIKKILNEKMAVEAEKRTIKEENEKKALELVQRIGVLEKEKQGLETEIMEKDEAIKAVMEENSCLEAMKMKLEMEINGRVSKSQADVELSQRVHLCSNVGVFDASGQKEGKKFASVAHLYGQKQSLNCDVTGNSHEDEITRANAYKRKQPSRSSDVDYLDEDSSFAKCKKSVREIHKPATHHLSTPKSTGVSQWRKMVPHREKKETKGAECTNRENVACCQSRKPKVWEVDQDLLDAFDRDRELCLKAICSLYRQHMLLTDSRNTSLLSGDRGFKPEDASKAIALAQYLIDEDPEGRMKRSVAELEQLDPMAVDQCIDIAKQHYQQVFEIYQKKVDPLFLP